jgi:hypothetical protein
MHGKAGAGMKAGATLSPCRRYRYALWREWDETLPTVVFCGLNPSTADETKDDPTIRRELGYARDWSFGRLVKVNAYGWRSVNPRMILEREDPIGPENTATVLYWAMRCALFVAAWGNHIRDRDAFVLRTLLRQAGVPLHVLRLTGKGNPHHPLYLPRNLRPVSWPGGAEWQHPFTPKEIKMTARDRFVGIEAEFWDCLDPEELTHTDPISALEACIEHHLNRASPVEDQIREMGAIPVEAYRKRKHEPSEIADAVDRAIDAAVEALDDEEHGHPEGDQPMFEIDVLAKARAAFETAVLALVAEGKIWQCEVAHTVELTPDETIEILRVERPEWFAPPSPTAAPPCGAAGVTGDDF